MNNLLPLEEVQERLRFMREALREAKKALRKGEVPIGAVIVKEGKVISKGHNQRESKQDVTLHAEVSAISKACRKLGMWRLSDCDIYITLEPCAMCAGAIIQSRMARVFIGADDPKAGAAGSVVDLFDSTKINHHTKCFYGILEDECSHMLKEFFKQLRDKSEK